MSTEGTSNNNWNRFSALNSFEGEDDPSTNVGSESGSGARKPLVDEDELEPTESVTRLSFSANPMAKLGLVFGGVVGLILLGWLLFTGMTSTFQSSSSQKVDKKVDKEEPLLEELPKSKNASQKQEVNKLKTDLAMSKQEQQLQAIDQPPPTAQAKVASQVAVKKEQPALPPPVTTTARPVRQVQSPTPVVIQPRRQPFLSPVTTTVRPVREVQSPTPLPVVTQPRRQSSLPPPPVAQTVAAAASKVDPIKSWVAAAQLGSYGQLPSTTEREQPNDAISDSNPSYQNAVYSVPDGSSQSQHTAQLFDDEEAPILDGRPYPTLKVGTKAKAVLATPVVWDETETTTEDRFTVVLTEPLLAADGSEVLPAQTQLIVELRSPSASGLVRLSTIAAIIEQQGEQTEIPLPQKVIAIRGSEGKPLIAQQLGGSRGRSRNNLLRIALGAAQRGAGLLNRSRSQSTFSNRNGFSSITENDDPNLLAGVAEGGIDALLDSLNERNRQAIQQTGQTPNVRFLPAGTEVEVFVNQSAVLDAQPVLSSRLSPTQPEQVALENGSFPLDDDLPLDDIFVPSLEQEEVLEPGENEEFLYLEEDVD